MRTFVHAHTHACTQVKHQSVPNALIRGLRMMPMLPILSAGYCIQGAVYVDADRRNKTHHGIAYQSCNHAWKQTPMHAMVCAHTRASTPFSRSFSRARAHTLSLAHTLVHVLSPPLPPFTSSYYPPSFFRNRSRYNSKDHIKICCAVVRATPHLSQTHTQATYHGHKHSTSWRR